MLTVKSHNSEFSPYSTIRKRCKKGRFEKADNKTAIEATANASSICFSKDGEKRI